MSAKQSGLSETYIKSIDQRKKSARYINNNDDRLFIAEQKVIEKLAKSSCVIVGRCADYILRDKKDVVKVFLYSDDLSKEKRAVKYYGLNKDVALKEIGKINKDRAKHYKFYTGRDWMNFNNYDISFNVDKYGVEKTANNIIEIIKNN